MKTMQTYTGSDATLEILIMLLGAFLLGAALMWLYNEYFTECIDEKIEDEDIEYKNARSEVETKKVVEETVKPVVKKVSEDDLKIIEGVGPKIEGLLKSANLNTLEDISNTSAEDIRTILREKGGERYAFHDPSTWPDQARLAFEGRSEELKEYQEFLSGGKA